MAIFAEDLVYDPQTSGGLLTGRSRGARQELLRQLHAGGFDRSVRIGKFVGG